MITSRSVRSIIVGSIALAMSTAHAADEPAPVGPKEVPISTVISMLRKEAVDGWNKSRQWPRAEPTFAWEKKWTVPDEQIMTSLGRKLDRNPAIDAYIKHQLLGFGPKIGEASADAINRISASMPKPAKQPEPSIDAAAAGGPKVSMFAGTQSPWLMGLEGGSRVGTNAAAPRARTRVLSSGSGLSMGTGSGGAMTHNDLTRIAIIANEQLDESRKTVETLNNAVYTLRDNLIAQMPEEGGVRLALLIKDVRDRVEAGDPRCDQAMKKLLQLAPQMVAEPTITPEVRRTLVGWAMVLGQMNTPVVESVAVSGSSFVYKRHPVAIPAAEITRLVNILQQRPAAPTP